MTVGYDVHFSNGKMYPLPDGMAYLSMAQPFYPKLLIVINCMLKQVINWKSL